MKALNVSWFTLKDIVCLGVHERLNRSSSPGSRKHMIIRTFHLVITIAKPLALLTNLLTEVDCNTLGFVRAFVPDQWRFHLLLVLRYAKNLVHGINYAFV